MATKGKGGQGSDKHDRIDLEECEGKAEMPREDLDHALRLLARWALRRGRKVLEEAGVKSENRVTGCNINGYGGHDESN